MFLEALSQAAREKCHLNPDDPVLVGVSGGADSTALMIGLRTLGYNLLVAHLDHGLRDESSQDAEFVSALANQYKLPFFCERMDVGGFAKEHGMSLEEAARQVRYEFLFKLARENNAQAVAVAHQADDQVETVLMHFLRGTALPGLSGMTFRKVLPLWDDTIPLVRPLLGVWRDMIEEYLTEIDVTPRIDRSNLDTAYFRNRLRHELIPDLATYNPSIREAIIRMSEVLREEDIFLKGLTEEAWQSSIAYTRSDYVEFYLSRFIKLNRSLQRRVLRRAISLLSPDLRDVGFHIIEKALVFANEPEKSGQIDLVSRLNVAVLEDFLIIKTWDADLPDLEKPLLHTATQTEELDIDHPVQLRHGWQLYAEIKHPIKGLEIDKKVKELKTNEAWLDLDRIRVPLEVRGRQKGDHFQPLGMSGRSQKLQDYFVNEKVPEHIRDVWPLVCSGDEIAWVCGRRPSETFKITENTDRIMHIILIKNEEQSLSEG